MSSPSPRPSAAGPPAVVVVTWLGGALVQRCILALRAQTLPPAELLVVVTSADPALAPTGVDTRITARPCGFATGANLGIRAVRPRTGPHRDVVLLNDDTLPAPDFLARLADARAARGEGLYQPRILLDDGSGRLDNTGHRLFPDGFNLARGRGHPEARADAFPGDAGAFSGAAVMLTGALLEEVGLFDEDLEAFGEDVDLSLRAVRRGYRIHTVPDARIHHVLGASYGRADPRKVFLVERNRIRAAVRSLPASALATMPLWTGLRMASLAAAAAAGRGIGAEVGWRGIAATVAGTAAGVAALPDAWTKRRSDKAGWSLGEREMWRHLLRHRVRSEDVVGRA